MAKPPSHPTAIKQTWSSPIIKAIITYSWTWTSPVIKATIVYGWTLNFHCLSNWYSKLDALNSLNIQTLKHKHVWDIDNQKHKFKSPSIQTKHKDIAKHSTNFFLFLSEDWIWLEYFMVNLNSQTNKKT